MTSSADTQIKKAYESEGMSPSEIAADLGFEETAVKAKLMQTSSSYRRACGHEDTEEDELNFSNDQLRKVNEVIFGLAISAEDEHLRFKAATFVRDDKKGRKEVVKAVQHNTFNLLQFNEALQSARAGASRIKEQLVKEIA